MKTAIRAVLLLLAVLFVGVTVYNASWRADPPTGALTLIAQRGISQLPDAGRLDEGDCPAARIEQPMHNYVENTVPSLQKSYGVGARMVSVDLTRLSDGSLAIFREGSLDCRTDGSGPVSALTADDLDGLDAGYGYTVDGTTFPMRGMTGQVPTLERLLSRAGPTALLFNMNEGTAEPLIAGLKAAGRDPVEEKDAFMGDAQSVAAIRAAYPDVWAFSPQAARTCAGDYIRTGWTGQMPASCAGETMAIPLNRQIFFWGWPNLLIERMAEVGGRIIVTGPDRDGAGDSDDFTGLVLPEQLGDVPADFKGHLLVDDIWTVGPALFPSGDKRGQSQKVEAAKAIERRRAAMDD